MDRSPEASRTHDALPPVGIDASSGRQGREEEGAEAPRHAYEPLSERRMRSPDGRESSETGDGGEEERRMRAARGPAITDMEFGTAVSRGGEEREPEWRDAEDEAAHGHANTAAGEAHEQLPSNQTLLRWFLLPVTQVLFAATAFSSHVARGSPPLAVVLGRWPA